MNEMKLLIAYDGSECASLALDDLRNAGLPSDVDATILSIADRIGLPAGIADIDPELPDWLARSIERAHSERLLAVDRMHARALAAAERLRREFPGWTVQGEAHADSPGWGIVKRAGELRPDLIVLGSHGHSAVGRLFLGSVSLKVLHAAPCSVRIARARPREPRDPLRILLGVDGSSHSLAAAHAVESRHWPRGTVVRVVSVLDALMSTAVVSGYFNIREWAQQATENETWVHSMASGVTAALRESGLEVEALVLPGDPKWVLVEQAAQWMADCIFLGSQGLNAVERLVLGSVSSAVASRAACSVEVIRSGGRT
jgi:nucleotide-binding universal stress UspA family protein